MREFRIGEVAELVGVSPDTVRRWADQGELPTRRTKGGHRMIDGRDLAEFLARRPAAPEPQTITARSARNRLTGIVTKVVKDRVVAQVEIQVGSHRIVSLMTAEAVDELGLEEGMLAVASVKATNVVVELPRR